MGGGRRRLSIKINSKVNRLAKGENNVSSIPEFTDKYHLPDGEHICTIKEVEEKFLFSEQRKRVWILFKGLLNRLVSLGLCPEIILINGSFVTGRNNPGDVDIAALIPPEKAKKALKSLTDNHDKEAIFMIFNPNFCNIIRNLFGAHILLSPDEKSLEIYSNFFRKGLDGKLREPDPDRDPSWVKRPKSKGILKVYLNEKGR